MHTPRSQSYHRLASRLTLAVACLVAFTETSDVVRAADAPAKLELKKGDHICIIGNTLAERMQHYGWLETLLHARFPDHELVIRNLGYSGDEVDGWQNPNHRMRSMSFGTQDEWLSGSSPIPQPQKLSSRDQGKVSQDRFALTNTKADVIFAFYGYNESFAGEAGLPKFKEDLTAFIKHTLEQKYNGKSAPRLVLFSPIAHDTHTDNPNLPGRDAVSDSNVRLKLYTEAMREVAAATNVVFVDLFTRTAPFTPPANTPVKFNPFTINGIHLNAFGDQLVSIHAIDQLLPDKRLPAPTDAAFWTKLDPLRKAVLDKNFYWYNRYRVTDGYSTYGERAFLKFAEGSGGYGDGLSNYSVGQRELETIDVLTANRDKVIWAAAKGQTIKPDDSNLPEFLTVITNKPGTLEGGKHLYLGGEDAIKQMTVHKGMQVSLFASEEKFPELVGLVQMAFDTRGRLWVAAWQTYPHWKPTTPMNDKLLILEDTNNDGKADVCKTFAGDLHNPTGFEFWNGGVIIAQGPDIVFLKDTDGDDKYDVKERILHGLDTADTHHTANSFTLDPGGALYFQEGTFHHTQVETPWGPPVRVANGAVFRYEPRAQKFDVYVSFGFANPHGHAFDRWGQDIVVDGTGAVPYHGTLFSGHIEHPVKHGRPPTVYAQRTRPCPGIEFVSSRHFPDDMQGNLLVPNVIGFQGILNYKVQDQGASLGATEQEPILFSSDPNFRPSDLEIAPDGSLYFIDWQNPIIGHMQHNLRDPSRDKSHGRVYRVTYTGRPLSTPAKIAGEPIEKLLDLLKEPEDRVRYRARIELSGRDSTQVIAATNRWMQSLVKNTADYEHSVLEALWVHQHHNVVDTSLLERVLASPDFRARAAGVRVLCYWRDRVSNTLDLLRKLAADEHPRVRLEAIRAASFLPVPEAVEIPLIAAELPSDQYLDFQRAETMKTLDPIWKAAMTEGRKINVISDAGTRYLLRNTATEQLLAMERNRPVYTELLLRSGLRDEQRRDALAGLAKLESKTELAVLLDAVNTIDGRREQTDQNAVFDLVRLLNGRSGRELTEARAELQKLATTAKQPVIRQIGFATLVNVDNSTENAWKLGTSSVPALRDLLAAVPLIQDPSLRAEFYPKIEPLLKDLPTNLSASDSTGTVGRFVRIELPTRGTLTLAEVEVYSNGRNIARQGKATQRSTANGGEASRAIDGNTSGKFGDGGQTHSEENSGNLFWQVDLGAEYPIDSIVVYNRTDGNLGKRLDGFTLKVLSDGGRRGREVFSRERIPAPNPKSTFELDGGGAAALVRRAAMEALVTVRGEEAKSFATLAKFVRDNVDRPAAIRAMQKIPKTFWNREEAKPLIDVLVDSIKKTPPTERTTPAALDALEFSDALASLLTVDVARKVRAELRELGVRVIKLGTLFERMSYDKDLLAVAAGKPVEILFENSDLMPHNFVLIQPGSLEELGLISEASATQPAFQARHYVPDSKKVLVSSTLLQPRETQKLSFVAPTKPGVYPYVCTYPGHWRRMYGALYVVEDLDDYLATPEAYLAAHPLPIVDELLKDRRPRTEWKFDDLASAVEGLKSGRSFGNGKQMFTAANCIACHKVHDVGNQFGPDLTKFDEKLKPVDILRELLDPSLRINEKFQPVVIETKAGKVITGLITAETKDAITLVENPIAKTPPVEIKIADIESRQKSPTSIMPKGLLDKLTKEEILDLVAFIVSRGDTKHALFQGASGHEHGAHKH